MSQYDYLVVGAGLTGAVFAHEAQKRSGKKCLVIDRRDHIAGNVFTEEIGRHKRAPIRSPHLSHFPAWRLGLYGPILRVQQLRELPVAFINGETYNMPFNMNTFSKLWGVFTPPRRRRKSPSR